MHTICELTRSMKVEKHDNINVIGQGQPQIMFLYTDLDNNGAALIKYHFKSLHLIAACQQSSRASFKKSKQKQQLPYITFNDKTTRETWHKMIREMQRGLLLARSEKKVTLLLIIPHFTAKKDLQFIKQAESNIIILGTILSSNLKCKTVLQKNPFVRAHLLLCKCIKMFLHHSSVYSISPLWAHQSQSSK